MHSENYRRYLTNDGIRMREMNLNDLKEDSIDLIVKSKIKIVVGKF